jgi:hypothetical protein
VFIDVGVTAAVTVAVIPAVSIGNEANRIQILEASAGFEPAVEVLQTSALPLG